MTTGAGPAAAVTAADALAERVAQAGIGAAALVCFATILLGSCGLLARWPLALLTAILFALAARAFRRLPPLPGQKPFWPWPLWLGLPLLLAQILAVLPLPPRDWDAMTYHLFLPARWLQEGRLIHVPTVFGDDSAAYAPQNGALIFTWWMALVGGDSLINLVQVAALALLAAALWLLVRRLGAGPLPAAMVLATLPWLEPVQHWTYSANVDLFFTAFFAAAAAFLLGDGRRSDLFFGGLSLGLLLGTKTLGLPLAALLLALAAPRLWRPPGRQGGPPAPCSAPRDLLLLAGAIAFTGSYWWLRNFALYGNPLFPLDVSLGSWRVLPGIFSSAAMRETVFHIGPLADWLQSLAGQWGASTCLVLGIGVAALPAARQRRPGFELALLALAWTCFEWQVVPFNNQMRFLLPVLVFALAGWGALLDRLPRPSWRVVAFVAALAALAASSRPDLFVRKRLAWLAAPAGPRFAALAEADYGIWQFGYLPLSQPGLAPKRVAYSGANVPYALVGPRLRNHVVYCNVRGRPSDGLWDFWQADRVPRPPSSRIYRQNEGAAVWLACLEEERIDTVAVFRMLPPLPDPRWPDDDDGFPVERRWMREHPERFQPELQQADAEIWSVRPWTDAVSEEPAPTGER